MPAPDDTSLVSCEVCGVRTAGAPLCSEPCRASARMEITLGAERVDRLLNGGFDEDDTVVLAITRRSDRLSRSLRRSAGQAAR